MSSEKRQRLDPADIDDAQLMLYVAEFKRRRQRNEALVEDVMQSVVGAIVKEECRALAVDMKRATALLTKPYCCVDIMHDAVLIKEGTEVNEPVPGDLEHFRQELDGLNKTRKWLNSRITHVKRVIRRCEEAARQEDDDDNDVLADIIAAVADDAVITVEDIEPW